MSTQIIHSYGAITPRLVDGFKAERDARTIVHTVLGREAPDITLRPPSLRRGRLRLVFTDRAAAAAAEDVLRTPQVLTLTDSTVPQVGMQFVVAGSSSALELDDGTRAVWVLEIPFQEVAP